MINKRHYLKSAMVADLATTQLPFEALGGKSAPGTQGKRKWKHWVWVNPRLNDKEEDLQRWYASYYEAGIRGIFFEASSEMHFRTAKQNQIEAHRWIWTLNRGEKSLLAAHPEFEVRTVTANQNSGLPLTAVHPHLRSYRGLMLSETTTDSLAGHDVVFLALPHGHSGALADGLADIPLVVDCGADHRLTDAAAWDVDASTS